MPPHSPTNTVLTKAPWLLPTETTYQGRNGYSLILNGLEKGINDRARERAIVMHGAAYADPSWQSGEDVWDGVSAVRLSRKNSAVLSSTPLKEGA